MSWLSEDPPWTTIQWSQWGDPHKVLWVQGPDIKLSKKGKEVFPYDIECKNNETWKGIYKAYDQADSHGNFNPIVFLKMNNRNPLVIVDAQHFINLKGNICQNKKE